MIKSNQSCKHDTGQLLQKLYWVGIDGHSSITYPPLDQLIAFGLCCNCWQLGEHKIAVFYSVKSLFSSPPPPQQNPYAIARNKCPNVAIRQCAIDMWGIFEKSYKNGVQECWRDIYVTPYLILVIFFTLADFKTCIFYTQKCVNSWQILFRDKECKSPQQSKISHIFQCVKLRTVSKITRCV